MRRRNAPLIVGIFAVVGVALVVALLLALGSGRIFRDRTRAVAYFDDSVNGLSVGGEVKFRGMRVGEVVEMRIDWAGLERGEGGVPIAVVMELNDRSAPGGEWDVQALVRRGLRAQLALESLLTNVRYVALDLRPETEATWVLGDDAPYPEIPTIPTEVEQLEQQTRDLLAELSEVDYQGLARSVSRLADRVRAFVQDPIDIEGIVDPQGTFARQLQTVLEEMEQAARAVRRLAEQLSRDPGQLLRGGRQ